MAANKRTNEEWRVLLAEQRASGQTQAAWCTANGVNLYTLRDRASRLRRLDNKLVLNPEQTEIGQSETSQPKPVSTIWAEITPERCLEETSGISIGHGGFTVTIKARFDAELLTAVLRAVRASCC